MRYFSIKAYKFPANDRFGFKESAEYITFCALGLPDLYKTVRCITPRGYRVPKGRTLGKRVNSNSPLVGFNLLKTKTIEIIELKLQPKIVNRAVFTNASGMTHELKVISNE